MTRLARIGSLCSGVGGLELGAEMAFGPLTHVWHGEYEPAPSSVLAVRWHGVPNLGDITAITASGGWADLEPIDILLAGYPCQPFSDAGLREGLDDPRNRWPDVWAAIRALRPRLVVLENVRGHLNRGFDVVVASLAAIGYVGRWRCVRASDAGAAHRRERLFVVAWPRTQAAPRLRGTDALALNDGLALLPTPTAERAGYNRGGAAGRIGPIRPSLDQVERLLPTPRSTDYTGISWHGQGGVDLQTAVSLLPTPRARDGKGRDPNPRGGFDLNEAVALLPTPKATDGAKGSPNQHGSKGDLGLPGVALRLPAAADRWGQYAPAIARWEVIVGRPAPEPTITSASYLRMRGRRLTRQDRRPAGMRGSLKPARQLSPLFVEWLMGLPHGHVTDVITRRSEALRALGNGVVPHAAALALRLLLAEPTHRAHVQLDLLNLGEAA